MQNRSKEEIIYKSESYRAKCKDHFIRHTEEFEKIKSCVYENRDGELSSTTNYQEDTSNSNTINESLRRLYAGKIINALIEYRDDNFHNTVDPKSVEIDQIITGLHKIVHINCSRYHFNLVHFDVHLSIDKDYYRSLTIEYQVKCGNNSRINNGDDSDLYPNDKFALKYICDELNIKDKLNLTYICNEVDGPT